MEPTDLPRGVGLHSGTQAIFLMLLCGFAVTSDVLGATPPFVRTE